jgi:hypothetical protein
MYPEREEDDSSELEVEEREGWLTENGSNFR